MSKIIIAPDSFKESMSAKEAAEAIREGFLEVGKEHKYDLIPMGDGGEGTMEALTANFDGKQQTVRVEGPNAHPVEATYALSADGQIAIMDMAQASGLDHVSEDARKVGEASTYGTGEMIKAALDQGAQKIILGIGGSATNDGGAGMIEALGARLLNDQGEAIARGGLGLEALSAINVVDLDPRLKMTEIVVACDVTNPLLGERGATAIYGPQKGADESMVKRLDDALAHFHELSVEATGKDVKDTAGAGAAGGLGAGLLAYLDAELKPGIDLVLEETDFRRRAQGADVVITGEGKIDGQSVYGKTPVGVAKAAKENDTFVIAICGQLGDEYERVHEHGIDAAFTLVPGAIDVKDAMENGAAYLTQVARNIAKVMWHDEARP
ncbi:glycerate kinase [Geomicrobium halophilum]|uniref:Glycerate kinase n=1 Tax=Geomicrobium halophilum TaxID=549000 RepID=A0A841Q0J5_9BACL|nr:glycerate kinase [Geomicrobium halophilum]MBB6450785.1 glycerate kinase [Geomicrobium halophilum]